MTITIRQKLKNGNVSVGSWMQIPSSSVAEIMGRSGFDWVAIDGEHGHFSGESLADIFRALELGGTAPFVRVNSDQMVFLKQALDAGAKGIIIPMVKTSKQLEEAISHILYPPDGKRGVGYSRANVFGKYFSNQVPSDNDEITIIAQIEHIQAVENLSDILSIERLDGIIIGPYDLSASMGITAQFNHPDFIQTLEKIKNKCKELNKPLGMHVVQPEPVELEKRIDEGYRFLAYSIDAVFLYNSCSNPRSKSNK